MPLHSLCAAAAAAGGSGEGGKFTANPRPIKPPSLVASPSPTPNQVHFPLPPPGLPRHLKEKILSLEVLGVDAGRALALNPAFRAASLDSVHAIISFLLSKGLHHKDLPRILGMCPSVLTASVPADLAPVFAFLSRDLGVAPADHRRVVNKCPRLLASSVPHQLRPALLYLRRLGFRDLAWLAHHEPVLLVSSVDRTLMPKLDFLVGLGLSQEDAAAMVLRSPGLFTFSIERNFKPKFEYLDKEMGRRVEELKEFPQYFAFSLEKRIKPRHEELCRRGMHTMPLPVMLKSTDEEFRDLMEKNTQL
ncbi:transcription termination factor MTEF1, chloroplastic-like [Curcuma longa]|uniref:transcription termination factor MTEF1, chloroplastic-like n=1 Tax=Curcuma longa TaxID=136217 RepID=UPI003D9F1DF3